MHYFDPTLDWPKELLEDWMPDVIVIHSTSLSDKNAPWAKADGAWTTEWIHYASADGADNFVNMIFFNSSIATEVDRRELAAYLIDLTRGEACIHKYRSTNLSTSLPFASIAPLIKCQSGSTSKIPRRADDPRSRSLSLKYEKIDAAQTVPQSDKAVATLIVEFGVEDLNIDTYDIMQERVHTGPLKAESSASVGQGWSGFEGDGVLLYVVASSLDPQIADAAQYQRNVSTVTDDIPTW